ncbi:MAG: hypothetical protein EZS28_054142, partial [Streblomastix strix]
QIVRTFILNRPVQEIADVAIDSSGRFSAVADESGHISVYATSNQRISKPIFIIHTSNTHAIRSVRWIRRLLNENNILDKVNSTNNFPQDRLISSDLHGHIIEWDLISLKEKQILDLHSGPIWDMSVSNDSSIIAVATQEGRMHLLSTGERKVNFDDPLDFLSPIKAELNHIQTFPPQKGRILSVCFSSNNKLIFSAGIDGIIRGWN